MKAVYIAHPLRGDWAGNLTSARRYVRLAVRLNAAPVAPYIVLDGMLDDAIEEDREHGFTIDLALLERCDEMWLCGPRVSEGMDREATHARRRGLRIASVQLHPDESFSFVWEQPE